MSKSYLLGKSDNFFVIHNDIMKQKKKILRYISKQEGKGQEYEEKICQLPASLMVEIILLLVTGEKRRVELRPIFGLMQVNSYFSSVFKDELTWKRLWYKYNVRSEDSFLADASLTWRMKVKYCTNFIVKAGTVRFLVDSFFYRSWNETYLVLSGRYLHIFDIATEQNKKEIIDNLARLQFGFDKILSLSTPHKVIDLRNVIVVHQQGFTDGYKVFGFKNIVETAFDEIMEWFAIPQADLSKLNNWFRMLFLYVDALKLDLKTKVLY